MTETTSSSLLGGLRRLLLNHAPSNGIFPSAIPGLTLLRDSTPTAQAVHSLHEPALCLVVQGAKQILLNGERYAYDAARYLLVSVEVPISGRVLQASPDEPYLCLRLGLDAQAITELMLQTEWPKGGRSDKQPERALSLALSTEPLLDAVLRLVRLLDTPEDIATLAPLAQREILYRLLKGEQGARLAQIAASDGQTQRVARAIHWLKERFDQSLRIEEMAQALHMSSSSLHRHFKAVTAMSPLQYQKQLRLQEARRLMLAQDLDAATAGHRVGYESPSQFGREYARLFGAPPASDLRRLRGLGASN